MNPEQIFERHRRSFDDTPIQCRGQWHQAIDNDPTVSEEIKVVLRWYWNQLEFLETDRDATAEVFREMANAIGPSADEVQDVD